MRLRTIPRGSKYDFITLLPKPWAWISKSNIASTLHIRLVSFCYRVGIDCMDSSICAHFESTNFACPDSTGAI